MRLLKQAMAILGTVVVIAAIVALVTPKTAHALAATMVQVVNTTANPASILNADMATRTPYQVTQSCFPPGESCFFTFPAAPAGTRLVIENVNATIENSTSVPNTVLIVNGGKFHAFSGAPGAPAFGAFYSSINQATHLIFDSSDGGLIVDAGVNTFASGFGDFFTLTGYTIDCAVAGCPAVTTH